MSESRLAANAGARTSPGVHERDDAGDDAAQVVIARLGTAAAIAELEATVISVLDQGRGQVVIDLGSVSRMSNAAISSLCAALRRVSRHRGGISVVKADPRTLGVLELCALDNVELR